MNVYNITCFGFRLLAAARISIGSAALFLNNLLPTHAAVKWDCDIRRRRIHSEEKAKVVAAAWGTELL